MRLWPQAWGAVGAAWRECFPLQGHDVARWFPGHMAKGEASGRPGGHSGRLPSLGLESCSVLGTLTLTEWSGEGTCKPVHLNNV